MKTQERKHSQLGASIAKRWLNCPGSVILSQEAPPPRESDYAKEGTLAHSLLEYTLKTEVLKEKVKEKRPKITTEMENHVQTAVNWIEENFCDFMGDELLVETKVNLSFIDPEMFGSLDVAIVRKGGKLSIIDFKYGAGVPVGVERNEQLLYYALGVAHQFDYDFTEVELVVIQPRAPHEDGTIRSWTTTIKDVQSFGDLLKKGVKRVRDGKTNLFSGDWCKFCPAASTCPKLNEKALQSAKAAFDDEKITNVETLSDKLPALPNPKDLAPDVIGRIMENADLLETWISEVRSYALGLLERGGKIKGFKLVNKRARRQWVNQKDAEAWADKFIGSKAFELRSPAQVEKLLPNGKEWVSKLAVAVSSGHTIASENDPRPSIDNIKDVFSDAMEGENNGEESSSQKESRKESGSKKESRKKGKSKTKGESQVQEESFEDFDLGF